MPGSFPDGETRPRGHSLEWAGGELGGAVTGLAGLAGVRRSPRTAEGPGGVGGVARRPLPTGAGPLQPGPGRGAGHPFRIGSSAAYYGCPPAQHPREGPDGRARGVWARPPGNRSQQAGSRRTWAVAFRGRVSARVALLDRLRRSGVQWHPGGRVFPLSRPSRAGGSGPPPAPNPGDVALPVGG